MKRQFGIRFDGLEKEVENLIKKYLEDNPYIYNFNYYEIGTAGAFTLRAISDIIKENITHNNWKATGLDLVNGYSLNWGEISQVFNKQTLQIFTNGLSDIVYLKPPNTRLLLFDNPREYSKTLPNCSLDIVLVDGNHNEQNVTEDFLSIEDKVKLHGLVLFHDIGDEESGTDPQVGGGFIEVKQAVQKLGLFDGSRPNWEFIKIIPGSRATKTGDGNSLGVFRKVSYDY